MWDGQLLSEAGIVQSGRKEIEEQEEEEEEELEKEVGGV